jgi:hypothetical protein
LTFKKVYIIKSAVEYFAENLYQVDKIFVYCFKLYSDFAALSTKKEVNGKFKYKIAAQKKRKQKKSEVLASLVSSIL